jgi:hypothetical protein
MVHTARASPIALGNARIATPLIGIAARKPVCRTSLDEEWAAIADALLKGEG